MITIGDISDPTKAVDIIQKALENSKHGSKFLTRIIGEHSNIVVLTSYDGDDLMWFYLETLSDTEFGFICDSDYHGANQCDGPMTGCTMGHIVKIIDKWVQENAIIIAKIKRAELSIERDIQFLTRGCE